MTLMTVAAEIPSIARARDTPLTPRCVRCVIRGARSLCRFAFP